MLLRDELTANIVLENTSVCCAHTQNSLTHPLQSLLDQFHF